MTRAIWIAVLVMAGVQTALAVPPDAGATFTNPQAQSSLEAGLAALKDADALEAQNDGTVSQANELPPALKAAYVRARTAFQDAAASDPSMAEARGHRGRLALDAQVVTRPVTGGCSREPSNNPL